MQATLLLADYAQVADGKLTVVGAGWSFTGPEPCPSAVGVLVDLAWNETNMPHSCALLLNDSDGRPVAGADGQPIGLNAKFEAGRPPGHPVGTPVTVPMALNLGPIPLKSGARFEWVLSIDDESRDEWRVGFNVRSAPLTPPTG